MSKATPSPLSLGKETWGKLRSLKERGLEHKPLPSVSINQIKSSEDVSLDEEKSQNSKKSWPEKREEYRTVINWLCTTFPSTFNFAHPLPLKLHITKDIYAHLPSDGSISKVKLRAAIQYYTHSTSYLHSLLKASHRVDLSGQEVELVLEAHKEFTQSILTQRQAKKKTLKPRKLLKKQPVSK